jgi:pyrimidine-specific ribonucleoside hydrolase
LRLWVDTDVGSNPDDAVALLVAAAHPDIDLAGVSTVDDADGQGAAVARELVDVVVVRGDDLVPGLLLEVDTDALLAIGPLTNVARLVEAGAMPSRVAVMGGALHPVRHRGAMRAVEHNFGADPAAAATVVRAADALLVCPLDVTARMRLDDADRERLARADARVGPMCDEWIATLRVGGVREPEAAIVLHDPLALLALLAEPVVRIERRAVVVSAAGALYERRDAPERDVVVDVDAVSARARIFDLLESGSR